jgi:hypothetical protein
LDGLDASPFLFGLLERRVKSKTQHFVVKKLSATDEESGSEILIMPY